MSKSELRKIPGVDRLLNDAAVAPLVKRFGEPLVVAAIREALADIRRRALEGQSVPNTEAVAQTILAFAEALTQPSLRPVINTTGIVLHTNLGRAPLGSEVMKGLEAITHGYSNLELDLSTAQRGQRNAHLRSLIGFLTGAEDAIVVNNNAAAVLLALKGLAGGKEVVVSRGELIEIGGSFRMPDIMEASGVRMVEVGTTNRTRIADYERAIGDDTRVLFKAHKSNFTVDGFTEDVTVEELAELGKRHGVATVYDLGSGLLKRPAGLPLAEEPDVRQALAAGVDLVTFSGDKLLGGPQAGLIVGKKSLVTTLAKNPLMRVLRVGKMTISALHTVVSCYLRDEDLCSKVPAFKLLSRDPEMVRTLAEGLRAKLEGMGVAAKVVESIAHAGGGTLPGLEIESFAVELLSNGEDKRFAERTHRALLSLEHPVLGVLRGRSLLFDLASVFDEELDQIALASKRVLSEQPPVDRR